LGNRAYSAVLRLNRYVNAVRQRFGYPYWSVAAFLKHKVKNAVTYIRTSNAPLRSRRGVAVSTE
jgi:UDP-2,3-diacylglucosamine pyrophosphatase LpxH